MKLDRLDILLKAKQIDEEIFNLIRKIEKEIKKWDDDKKWRFLVHASIALNRIKQKNRIENLDQNIVNQIKENENFKEASKKYDDWFGNFSEKIPEYEKWYIFIHILNYLEDKIKWK